MAKLDQEALSQIVQAVLANLQGQGTASPKPASQYQNSFGKFDPIARDRQLLAAFHRRGFRDVQLMDRADKSKPFNVKPYKVWIELGRRVRKGEKGVRGLFHQDQTDPIKPELAPERRSMFKKAAAKAKQPQLVK
jgi:hypothetical protein